MRCKYVEEKCMQPDEFIQGLKDVYEMLEDQLSKELYLEDRKSVV